MCRQQRVGLEEVSGHFTQVLVGPVSRGLKCICRQKTRSNLKQRLLSDARAAKTKCQDHQPRAGSAGSSRGGYCSLVSAGLPRCTPSLLQIGLGFALSIPGSWILAVRSSRAAGAAVPTSRVPPSTARGHVPRSGQNAPRCWSVQGPAEAQTKSTPHPATPSLVRERWEE